MRWFYKLPLRFRSLFHKSRVEQELTEELRFHLEKLIGEKLAQGMPAEDAPYAALRELGGIEQIKEECRDVRRINYVESFAQDARYGLRQLRRSPGFTAVAVITLGLGIGANTAIFSAINGVMLKTLPVKNPEQLVILKWTAPSVESLPYQGYSGWTGCPHTEGRPNGCSFSYPMFERLQSLPKVFSGVFGFVGPMQLTLAGNGQAGLVWTELVTGQFFSTLGVQPILGRALTPQDDTPDAPAVAVISYDYWNGRFGKDPSVIGKAITVNTHPFTIVGVAPPEFFGLQMGWPRDLWMPLARQRELHLGYDTFTDQQTWWIETATRLKPGVAREQAQAAADVTFHQGLTAATKKSPRDLPWIELAPLTRGLYALRRTFSKPLFVLMCLVGLVLLVACANVAGLMLARGASRQREVAVRLAIGAGRARLVRQFLTESVLLAAMGGGAGFLLAYWGAGVMRGFIAFGWDKSLAADIRPDLTVLGFTALVSMLTGLLFGLAPALRGSRVDVTAWLKGDALVGQGRKGRLRLGFAKALVALQTALSVLLLVGAGLFVRTLRNLENENLGFNQGHLLLFSLEPESSGYDKHRTQSLYQELQRRMGGFPGVLSVSYSDRALISESYFTDDLTLAGHEIEDVRVLCVGPQFFETMQIPVLLGRGIGLEDNENSPRVAVINEALARRLADHPNPLGLRFRTGKDAKSPEIEIEGLVASTKYEKIQGDTPPTLYVPYPQSDRGSVTFEVRTSGDPKAAVGDVRRLVSELAKDVPLSDLKTQEEQIAQTLVQERMFARLSSFFGLLALVLASTGLYGLMSYAVARRTSEIGVRMALGAERGDVLWMVLRESLAVVALGIVLGLAAAWGATRAVSSMLYGLKPTDPVTMAAATLLLFGVAALAGYLPARRASRLDPMVALRYE
jgi:predicted permease